MATVNDLKNQIDNLIKTVNELSLGEIIKNQGELLKAIEKINMLFLDFGKIVRFPPKPFSLDVNINYQGPHCKERIISLLRENGRYFDSKEIASILGVDPDYIRNNLRQLKEEDIVKCVPDKIVKNKLLWRIA